LTCLKVSDGSQVWAVNYVKDFGGSIPQWGYSESVLIDGDKVVCSPGGGNGAIVALNKKTGKEVWRCKELKDSQGYASLISADVGGVRQYITQFTNSSQGPGGAVGVRASDGKLLWRINQLGRRVAAIPSPIVHDGYAFFSTGYSVGCELIKLDADENGGTKATLVYTNNKLLVNHHGGVIRLGDYLYGYSDQGGWVCLDFQKEDKEAVSSFKFEKGAIISADGLCYLYGESSGTCVLVDANPKEWKEKGRFTIPEKSKFPRKGQIWTHPVIANGKLYLRDHEVLMCFDIAAK
jgi:outer membrane protein assembly factor BamB